MTLLSSITPPTPTDAGANSIMSTPIKPTTTATTTKENDDAYTPCKTAASTSPPPSHQQPHSLTTPEDWYLQGERVWYDPQTKQVVVHEEDHQDHQVDEQQPQPREEGQEEQEEESGEDSVDAAVDDSRSQRFKIFQRIVVPEDGNRSSSDIIATPQRWMTFLPNNPEGSYGFHMVEEALSCGGLLPTRQRKHPKNRCDTDSTALSAESITETNNESLSTEETAGVCLKTTRLARLYLDYQGQGDSDTFTASSSTSSSSSSTTPPPSPSSPTSSASSGNSPFGATTEERSSTTKQRADLVEALWEANGIKRTVVVSAGDSSLVVMELLQRQRQRLATGCPFPKILHVLSLNGRYVAKTRHAGQLATITQCLRSERMGSPLANKAQKSDFTLSQCLGPYLKGSSRPVRKQVAKIVKRHNGASSLVEMARTVDDHLYEKHRYRWHLPHLFKVFTLDQGITFHLVTNTRSGQRQVQLVQQQLEDYDLLQQEDQTTLPGLQVNHYGGLPRAMSTSTFLLDSSTTDQFETFIKHVRQLAFEEIPLSDNSCYTTSLRHSPRPSSFDQEDGGAAAQQQQQEGDEVDSWHPNEEETSLQDEEHENDDEGEEPSLDTRLDREIVFDASEMEDDDFDFF